MVPKKDKGKKKMAISQGSTTRGKKRRNSTTQAESQTPFVRLIRRPRTASMGRFGEELPRKPTRIDIHGGR